VGAPVVLYDTTLRDGTQGENITLSLADKLRVARMLDEGRGCEDVVTQLLAARSAIDRIAKAEAAAAGAPREPLIERSPDPHGPHDQQAELV